MHKIELLGVIGTIIYAMIFGSLIFLGWDHFKILKPNEWGDFFAGVLGPLAIFWLVLGFFLQGRELQHSVDALKLQADELKNSVEQQSRLVAITEKQLIHETSVREDEIRRILESEVPFFILAGTGGSGGKIRTSNFKIQNRSGDALNFEAELDKKSVEIRPKRLPQVLAGAEVSLSVLSENALYDYDPLVLKISAIGRNKHRRIQKFILSDPLFPEIENSVEKVQQS